MADEVATVVPEEPEDINLGEMPGEFEKATPEDRALAASALRKLSAGESPTSVEKKALTKLRQAQEEEQRWAYYRTIPQRHYVALSGRPCFLMPGPYAPAPEVSAALNFLRNLGASLPR